MTIALGGDTARVHNRRGKSDVIPTGKSDEDEEERRSVFRTLLGEVGPRYELIVEPRAEDTVDTIATVVQLAYNEPAQEGLKLELSVTLRPQSSLGRRNRDDRPALDMSFAKLVGQMANAYAAKR